MASSLVLLCCAASAQAGIAPQEGEVFPELSFPTLDGAGLASLKDYRGKKVLLMQFASW